MKPSHQDREPLYEEPMLLELTLPFDADRPITPPLISPDMSTQSTKLLSSKTPRKKKLKESIHTVQSQVGSLKKIALYETKKLRSLIQSATLQDFKQ